MNISQMHQWFRQYAQQMGMQNVRALLPEQIDLLINTSITDTVNRIVTQSIGLTNDRVITDNSKIGQINALRTLYTVKEIVCYSKHEAKIYIPATQYNIAETNLFELTGFNLLFNGTQYGVPKGDSINSFITKFTQKLDAIDINYESANIELTDDESTYVITLISSENYNLVILPLYGGTWGQQDTWIGTPNNSAGGNFKALITGATAFNLTDEGIYPGLIKASIKDLVNNCMQFVDFAVNYTKVNEGFYLDGKGFPLKVNGDKAFTSNYFPVRLVEDAYLADILNDFVLKPRLRTPIVVVYGDNIDLYIESFKKNGTTYTLNENLVPYKFRISYIAKPNVVAYKEDITGNPNDNVNCDLPEYLHEEILKHAVDLYRASITGTILGQQEQMRQQQQEIARNEGNPYANNINNNNSNQ